MQGPSSYNVVSQLIVVNTGPPSGIFVYAAATPATGQLVLSIAASGGTDSVSNNYLPYITLYSLPGENPAIQLAPGGLFFQPSLLGPGSIADAADLLVIQGPVNTGGFTTCTFSLHSAVSPIAIIGGDFHTQAQGSSLGRMTADGGVTLPNRVNSPLAFAQLFMEEVTVGLSEYLATVGNIGGLAQWYTTLAGRIVANDPSTSVLPETWHTMTLTAGQFTAGGTPPRFRLEPIGGGGVVRLTGAVNLVINQAAGTTFFTLPSGYHPAAQKSIVCANDLAGAIASNPVLQITTGGALQLGVAGNAGQFIVLDGVTFELD